MKQRLKKLLAVILSAAMCMPVFPAEAAIAAESGGVIFNEPESVGVTELGSERSTLFNEDWKFFLGESNSAQDVNFNDSTWENVTLPHDFSISQEFTTSCDDESGYLPGGTGWYRKTFTLPASCQNKSVILNFDGVYKNAYVYVNGSLLGEHRYGYSPFAFDLSGRLICDGVTDNVIAVKVVHQTPSSRWYSGSGIYRDVNLIITDPVHVNLDGTEVTTPNLADSNGADGTVKVKVNVVNDSNNSATVAVSNKIYDASGSLAATSTGSTVTVTANGTATAEDTAVVSEPKLWTTWSKGEQNLYRVHTELSVNGSVVDEYDSVLGFRWFEFDDTVGFKLNGENVKLNGMCMHHDQGALGSAAYYDAVYRQLSIMKNMGVNAIRIVHNPGNRQYLEICNELGLIAIEEFFDGWDRSKNGNRYDFAADFTQNLSGDNQIYRGNSTMTWAEYALKSTVRRDRNNPSLILWSLGNEISEGGGSSPAFPQISRNLIQWMKEEDSVRQVTHGQNKVNTVNANGEFSEELQGVIDAIVESGGIPGFNYGDDNKVNQLADKYGCIIASETASHTNSRGMYKAQTNNGAADGRYHLTSYDTSSVSWGRNAHDSMWRTINRDNVAGQFVWTGFDYIGEPTPWNSTGSGGNAALDGSGKAPIPNSSYFGVVETSGFEKDSFYLYRSQWKQDDTTLHLVTAWDPDNMMNSGGKTPVWIYSNAPVVKLYRNGTQIGTATRTVNTTPAAGHTFYTYAVRSENESICTAQNASGSASLYSVFNVAYEEGTISAKAFEEDGTTEITEVCGKSSVSTPGAAAKLKAGVDKTEIAADGSSFAYITVDVTDAKDVLDTTASNEITVSLSGEGEIAGVDNGEQPALKKYQQPSALLSAVSAKIDAYAGKALVIVRSGKTGGKITVNLSADGLAGTSVDIDAAAEETAENEIAAYRMVKHFYAPAGTTNITLPDDVEVSYTDGTKKNLKITWNPYSGADFAKAGTVRIDGSFTADGKQVGVFITGHIYNAIAEAGNCSMITRPGVMPVLPSVVMTYYADGTPFESFPVNWNLIGITADTFDEAGKIVEIRGTVTALGTTCPVTANVRVAEPVIDKHENVANAAARLTENRRYSDSLSAVNDGVRTDTGVSASRWSTYNQHTTNEDAIISMAWDTPMTTDLVDLYYYYEKAGKPAGNGAVSQLPTSVKFEYALSCTWNESEQKIENADWKEITFDPEKVKAIDGATNVTTGYSYPLDAIVSFQAFRIILGRDVGKFIGLNEIEILKPTESFYANTSADLDGISIGGVDIDFDDEKTEYVIDVPSLDNIKIANAFNAAVTMVRASETEVKLIAVSEDGKTTKTYTIKLNKPDLPPKNDENQKEQLKEQLTKGQKATIDGITYEVLDPVNKTVIVTACDKNKSGKLTIDKAVIGKISCTVTAIGDNAFKKAGKLSSVTIADSVTSIGKNAFSNCKKLKTIVFGMQVKNIGAKAFLGCKSLKNVKFNGSVLPKIGKSAFKNTKSGIKVKAPKKLKKNKNFKKNLTKAGMKSLKI